MASAPTHPTLHRLILLITLLAATWVMAHQAGVRFSGQAGVARQLPDRVGPWRGEDLLSCQTMTCQWSYARSELLDATVCPRCQGPLSAGSPVEWSLLPADTDIIKKIYTAPDGSTLVAAIVLSGRERTSIHRPQICLVGGGQEIVATYTRRIHLPDGSHFSLAVLDLLRRGITESGQPFAQERFFAYWFAGPNRVTSSHWARMFWMGFERIFQGTSHRWAYISVSGIRTSASEEYLRTLDAFVRDFYPQVVKLREDG